ncbi:ATP-binding protein [Streptomyces sp. NPDC059255]|uniref:ATP-binding protein n=1 Tax=Streptomyces sp. NPDC059255 TaxID=3346793 RepID=UPI003687BE7A
MARSPAPPPLPRGSSPWLWPATLVVALAAFAIPLVPLARMSAGAAVAYGSVAALLLGALAVLRGRHHRAEYDASRFQDEAREREAEAVRRETGWRTHAQQRSEHQAELIREEVEHLVNQRLPAALTRSEIPAPLHGGEQLGLAVGDGFDLLLSSVTRSVQHREESQRLALVELASRVQTSAHRIQAAVTSLADRFPGDADLLETTMRVDHAATQQARHAQSLKVLCGEWPGQQWQKPLAMVDVVRAASGRIVAYQRVQVTGDPDLGVTPSIVEPLIHLLAELLANATEYSPPRTAVPVTVRTVQRGAVVEVDDGGLGMDEYRLADAREVVSGRRLLGVGEIGEIPQTGFAVVGRFADRHGFHVDLGPSPYGGVRAVVLVPREVLQTLPPAGTAAVPLVRRRSRVSTAEESAPEAVLAAAEQAPSVREERAGYGAPAPTGAPVPADAPLAAPARGAEPPPPVPAVAEAMADGVTPYVQEPVRRPAPERAALVQRLPQRRSRRDEYAPVESGPVAATPPGTPEQAGDWMEQFIEGGRSVTPSDLVPHQGHSVPHQGQRGPAYPTPPDSPEGLT